MIERKGDFRQDMDLQMKLMQEVDVQINELKKEL
jgi:hypothetical protein